MSQVRNQFVRQMAGKILVESKIRVPPVDLLQILSAHGIGYEEVEDFPDTVDALIVEDGVKVYAAVNAKQHPHRRRFSLAHELGHYFMHREGMPGETITINNPRPGEIDAPTKSPAETEADLFAGELLVPLGMLKPHVHKGIPELSQIFLVSEQVISNCIVEMSSEPLESSETAHATTEHAVGVRQVRPSPLSSCLLETELSFYHSYPWSVNVFPTVGEIRAHLQRELRRAEQVPAGWQLAEVTTNIFLLACAVADALDDYLLGEGYDFAKAAAKLPTLAPAFRVAEGILSLWRKSRELVRRHLRDWRRNWDTAVVEFVRSILLNSTPDPRAISTDTGALASLLTKRLPTGLLARRPRPPAAFISQDLTHLDALALARKFVAAFPDRQNSVLVLGLRTAGSYFAPVVCAYLKSEGYQRVDSGTLRPKREISLWEANQIARFAASGSLALIVDEPMTTGYTVAQAVRLLRQAGVETRKIVASFPVHPTRGNWESKPEFFSACEITTLLLAREEWHKCRLLEPQAVGSVVQEYFLARGYRRATLTFSPQLQQCSNRLRDLCVEKGHIRFKRIYEVRLEDSDGNVETRYVLAKSIGWGWLAYHAFLAADRLSSGIPPALGVRNGILFTEWLPEAHSTAKPPDREQLVGTLASYIAARVRSLALEKDPAPDLLRENNHRGLELLANTLSRAYRHRIAAALKRSQIREKLSHIGCSNPTLIDGKMRRVEWICGPERLLKTDFDQHGLGKTELNVTDPAYDLAEAVLYWDLSPAEERNLLARYAEKSGDNGVEKRLLLHKLLAGIWAMTSALDHLESPNLVNRHAEFHQQYVQAWNFLVIHTTRFCGRFVRPPTTVGWHAPLVMLDIDGVLDDRIFGFPSTTASGIQAVALLHAHDFAVAVNTARSITEVQEYCQAYGFLGGVAEYGSALWDAVAKREFVLVSPECLIELEKVKIALREIPGIFLNDSYRYSIRVYSFENNRTVPVPTLMIRALLTKLGVGRLKFHQTFSDTAVLARDLDKGTGLQSLLTWVGMPEQETVAIGDSEADLAMFRVARRSFAPSQIKCRERARLLGCQIADRSHQSGLLRIVRSLTHPEGGQCEHCRAVDRLWPKGTDLFLDLLERADKKGPGSMLEALFDPVALRALVK
jgi:orotate phosphoribosyltransferase